MATEITLQTSPIKRGNTMAKRKLDLKRSITDAGKADEWAAFKSRNAFKLGESTIALDTQYIWADDTGYVVQFTAYDEATHRFTPSFQRIMLDLSTDDTVSIDHEPRPGQKLAARLLPYAETIAFLKTALDK